MRIDKIATFQNEHINAIIETPKGSRLKYVYDIDLDVMRLKKELPGGLQFPFDFGFIPHTAAEDGDPLDVLVLMNDQAIPGCLIECRVIGAILARQEKKGKVVRNDRVLAVPALVNAYNRIQSINDLKHHSLDSIEKFFTTYNQKQGIEFTPLKRIDAQQAFRLVKKSVIKTPGGLVFAIGQRLWNRKDKMKQA